MGFLPPKPAAPSIVAPRVVTPSPVVSNGRLPASFARDGFAGVESARPRRRLMIGTEGEANTGKTEFILSCPGPGIVICLDRGYDAMLDNETPPPTRRPDFAFKPVSVPLQYQADQEEFKRRWKEYRELCYKAVDNPDSMTVGLDGDSDSWELQRLAEFGTLTNVRGPVGLAYTGVNAARRGFYARLHDACKVIIATNKVKDEYEDQVDANGKVVMGDDGKPRRSKSGRKERQGFSDHEYLWQLQLRHMYRESRTIRGGVTIPQEWGIKILMCKHNRELEGIDLWGNECNFAGLVQTIYPNVPLEAWGFK